MKLYEFCYSEKTMEEGCLESFLAMMREKYPVIINRKRFCCHPEEITPKLLADIVKFDVSLKEIT